MQGDMPNRQYESGRRAEYKCMKEQRRLGYSIVTRSAGSHSPIDVIAIDPLTHSIRLIQVKSGNSAEREKAKVRLDILALTGEYHVEGCVE
jgi:hypothetical protein